MNQDALATLRDIHLPEPSAWWTMQEVWAIAACVAVAAVAAAWLVRRRLRNRLLRQSLHALSLLEQAHARDGDAVRLARGLSQLLRRHAAACYPHMEVDGLAGSAWLAFLDAHGGGTAFVQGAGAVLDSLPYRASGSADTVALVKAVRQWLQENPR